MSNVTEIKHLEEVPALLTHLLKEFADLKLRVITEPIPQQQLEDELPIGFDRATEILGLKERTVRAKIAAKEIPHYQRGGKLYFFASELIKYIKDGKIKTSAELTSEASEYIVSKPLKKR